MSKVFDVKPWMQAERKAKAKSEARSDVWLSKLWLDQLSFPFPHRLTQPHIILSLVAFLTICSSTIGSQARTDLSAKVSAAFKAALAAVHADRPQSASPVRDEVEIEVASGPDEGFMDDDEDAEPWDQLEEDPLSDQHDHRDEDWPPDVDNPPPLDEPSLPLSQPNQPTTPPVRLEPSHTPDGALSDPRSLSRASSYVSGSASSPHALDIDFDFGGGEGLEMEDQGHRLVVSEVELRNPHQQIVSGVDLRSRPGSLRSTQQPTEPVHHPPHLPAMSPFSWVADALPLTDLELQHGVADRSDQRGLIPHHRAPNGGDHFLIAWEQEDVQWEWTTANKV